MNTIDGIIEDLELEDSCVGGCTTKGEIIECLENLKILQKEKEAVLKALEDVKAETERQYKWLFNTKYTRYDVDIAFNSIFRIIDKYRNKAESEDKE